MRTKKLVSIAAASVMAAHSASAAIVYQLDLQKDSQSTTQTGWTASVAPNGGSAATSMPTPAGVTITAGGSGYFQGRAGGTWGAVNVTDADWNNLVGDTAAARNGNGTVIITFSGLALNTEHQLTAWHNVSATDSSSFSSGSYTITPSITTGSLVGTATNGQASNIKKGSTATAADFNNSIISFTPDGSGNATVLLTSASTSQFLTLSGVQLESVPEPSASALLGLGGVALILRRRK